MEPSVAALRRLVNDKLGGVGELFDRQVERWPSLHMLSQVQVGETGVCLTRREKDDLHSPRRDGFRDLLPRVLLDAHVVFAELELAVDVVRVDLHRDTEVLLLELSLHLAELPRDGGEGRLLFAPLRVLLHLNSVDLLFWLVKCFLQFTLNFRL